MKVNKNGIGQVDYEEADRCEKCGHRIFNHGINGCIAHTEDMKVCECREYTEHEDE